MIDEASIIVELIKEDNILFLFYSYLERMSNINYLDFLFG